MDSSGKSIFLPEDESIRENTRENRNDTTRGLLVEKHLSLARAVASRLFKNRCDNVLEFNDYYHYAVVGLLEAFDKFDESSGVPFENYAKFRIKGAILNGIQKSSEKSEQIAFRKRLLNERLNSIKNEPLKQDSNQVFEELVNIAIGMAISYMLEDSGIISSRANPTNDELYTSIAFDELKKQLKAIVEQLPSREKSIIYYHYYHGLRFTSIAKILDITKGRVSQIHKKAVSRIRELFEMKNRVDDYY
ncbi:MAG: sigma-70 family RNA polymerase sigma factor [Candidatus Thiodiazotropha sp. (ex Dulcina madagascariensis)]|nr:sigma-70 family RNA polymerase sigma factor [Candidatus Thiodiazotropha sp. (ex Epidulcina cf. delphinae)]MCU7922523.1 sigma-70 family RNA polymerase sigma factor [Candidatus Thiodiazotropha sp. (ex Dulcina madagascariensis)]MCU7925850.1 sigma-70 family RNA polymerase sigma factor [Candidatus Thiodiazotropha sp. (ex Dulcina madagascariensis)]